jgi:hypothetical protein
MAEHFNSLLDRETEHEQEKQVQKEERHNGGTESACCSVTDLGNSAINRFYFIRN